MKLLKYLLIIFLLPCMELAYAWPPTPPIITADFGPSSTTYITQTADATLTAEQALAGLSTGIMRVATTTGTVTSLTDSAGVFANVSDETGGTGVLVGSISPVFTTDISVQGLTGAVGTTYLTADAAEDNSDKWKLEVADGGNLTIESYTSGAWVAKATLTNAGELTGGVATVTDADGFTMSAAQAFGYVIYATGAGTIVIAPAIPGGNFSVEVHAAASVVLDPDASGTEDTIRLNGVDLAQGANVTCTALTDIAVVTYYAADKWSVRATSGCAGP